VNEESVLVASDALGDLGNNEIEAANETPEYNRVKKIAAGKRTSSKEIESDASNDISAMSNVISYTATEDKNVGLNEVDIDYFNWLVGNWKASYNGKEKSIQNWNQKDQFTLEGKAILTINGEELLVENLEIKKIENQLYFIRVNMQSGETVKYHLTSIEAGNATFRNSTIDDQFMLMQNGMNNFSQQVMPSGMMQMSQFPGANQSIINFEKTKED